MFQLDQLQRALRKYETEFMGGQSNIEARRFLNGLALRAPWTQLQGGGGDESSDDFVMIPSRPEVVRQINEGKQLDMQKEYSKYLTRYYATHPGARHIPTRDFVKNAVKFHNYVQTHGSSDGFGLGGPGYINPYGRRPRPPPPPSESGPHPHDKPTPQHQKSPGPRPRPPPPDRSLHVKHSGIPPPSTFTQTTGDAPARYESLGLNEATDSV